MASYSTSCSISELAPNAGWKEIIVETPATTSGSDTITVTLTDYGISTSGFLGIQGYVHPGKVSTITQEDPTTTVGAGSLTITTPSSIYTFHKRVYRILGKSN